MSNSESCPESLKSYSDEQISDAFRQAYSARRLNLNANDSKSLFGKVFTVLTKEANSSVHERLYLNKLWNEKLKEEIHNRKTTKAGRTNTKGKGRRLQDKKREKELNEQARLLVLDARSQIIQKAAQNKAARTKGKGGSKQNKEPSNSNIVANEGNPPQLYPSLPQQSVQPTQRGNSITGPLDNQNPPNPPTRSTSQVNENDQRNNEEIENRATLDSNQNHQQTNNNSRFRSSLRRCYDQICSQILVPTFKRVCTISSGNVQQIILPSTFNGFAYSHSRFNTQQTQLQNLESPLLDEFIYNAAENLQKRHEDTLRLINIYNEKIYIFPTLKCPVCLRMLYPFRHNKKRVCIQDTLRTELHKFGCSDFDDLEQLHVCSRCHTHLQKNKIPPQAYFNNNTSPAAPQCLSNLTDIEIRIISQVKPHMRIFHLSKGRGQAAIKGSCIHFPQQIEEIIEQLPLTTANNDMIIVNESGHAASHEYQVRPAAIREALLWLKENNHLYANIQIQDIPEEDLQVHEVNTCASATRVFNVPTPPPRIPQRLRHQSTHGYTELPHQREILRADVSQADFLDAANQCTGMAAVAIAYASYRDPATWILQNINEVLDFGNRYYKLVRDRERPNRSQDNPTFEPREIAGQILLFNHVNINVTVQGEPIMGGFNKFPDNVFPEAYVRLNAALAIFIDSIYNYAIFTNDGYSIAVIKTGRYVYYFDSHPRTDRGRKGYCMSLRGDKLRACIMKYEQMQAAEQISEILHHNFQPTAPFQPDPDISSFDRYHYYNHYSFVLQTFAAEILDDNLEEQLNAENDLENDPDLPQADNAEGQSEREDPLENFGQPEPFGNRIFVDSVIQPDDFVEPDIDEFRNQVNQNKVNLQRDRGRPLYGDKHSRLEELSFVRCFPTGTHGLKEPRIAKITTLDYFQRRIMGDDPRFKTNEYLFYALAQVDKDAVESKIAICGKMRKQAEGLNENAERNGHIIDKNTAHTIMVAVRGSASYWKKYGGDIVAMISQLGTPHIFLTVSYDDLNSKDSLTAIWKSNHGENAEVNPDTLSYAEKRDAVNGNPVAAARHYCQRIGAFLSILKSKSTTIFGKNLADYTYRVEFQDRGAAHIHMLIWFEDMPAWDSTEGMEFIDNNISCSLDVHFREFVEKYQSHRHMPTCFKKKNGNCRFGYPRPTATKSRLFTEEEIEQHKGRFFEIKRRNNETYINNYHPILLQMFKCNMDIQVITNAKSIAYYIAKYISKAEPDDCRPETSDAIAHIQADQNSSYYSKAMKIASLILKQREVGGPEAGWRFARLPLRMSSRSFVFLPTYKPEDRTRMVRRDTVGTGAEQFCLNTIDRYINRPNELAEICLMEFAAYYKPAQREDEEENEEGDNIEYRDDEEEPPARQLNARMQLKNGKGSIVRRTQAAIVKTPQFDPLSQKDNYYYSLIVLYQPFTAESFLEDYPSVTDAFQALRETFRSHADDRMIRPGLAQELEMALAQLLIPASVPDNQENQDTFDLGADVQNIFEEVYEPLSEQDVFQAPNVLADLVNEGQDPPAPERLLQRRYETMNREQRQIYHHVHRKLFDKDGLPLRLFVQGEAGSGKSYIIDSLSVLIETLHHTDINGRKTLVRAAQTGVAAKNIAGVTLHRLFSLSVEKNGYIPKCRKLGGQKLQERRNVLRHVEWIIIDEISMVSYQTLQNIDSRLRDIYSIDEPFAGKNILLFGDLLQLKPVLGNWCFQQPPSLKHELDLWRLFTIYELATVVRQRNDNLFRNILGKLRTGDLLESDMAPLRERILCPSNPRYQELVEISNDSLHIYPHVAQVDKYNQHKMDELKAEGNSIFVINCIDKIADPDRYGAIAPDAYIPQDDRKCGGIPRELHVAIGCRVMLRRNISVEGGLVNGSMGSVQGIGWAVRRDGPVLPGEQPQFIAVKFDDEVSSHLLDQDGCYRLQTNSFEFDGKYRHRIIRIQFPIMLCYACTVHKVQGLTLQRAAVHLGMEMFTAGMAYVALSRLRSLDGLVILKLDDSRVLWTKKFMKPCNKMAFTEITRLRIQREMPEMDDEHQRELALWMVEYPICKNCKFWICMCKCKN